MPAIASFANSTKQNKFTNFQRVTTATMVNSDTDGTTLCFAIAAFDLSVSLNYYIDLQPYITLCRDSRNLIINTELENSKSWLLAVL